MIKTSMAKNNKSATLPSNLRHRTQPTTSEENENFFTKLRRKLKFKKGKYHVDLNTGECENVNPVSFKKRSSAELLDDDEPLKHGVGRSSERSSRSESPRSYKPTSRSNSDRLVSGKLSTISSHERKTSNSTYSEPRYPQMTSGEYIKTTNTSSNTMGLKSETTYKGNEYSVMRFDKDDLVGSRPPRFDSEQNTIKEGSFVQDDSAIDLDTFERDSHKVQRVEAMPYFGIEPGYEHLPIIETQSSGLDGCKIEIPGNNVEKATSASKQSQSSFEFDPHYQSVNDLKTRMNNQFSGDMKTSNSFSENTSKSMESLDDPQYQSIRDVKKKIKDTLTDSGKPFKTYDASKSIESLDEPGYESLNDVKKRISMSLMQNNLVADSTESSEQLVIDCGRKDNNVTNLNDSAISFSVVNESETVGTKSQSTEWSTEEEKNIVQGAEMSLTESSMSRDSGFDNKLDKGMDTPDCLYSTVKKRTIDGGTEKKTENSSADLLSATENKSGLLHDEAGKHDGISLISAIQTEERKSLMISANQDEAPSLVPVNQRVDVTEYDSDTELVLDPGYAECADAIKGIPPYHAFSDGSESKISSCTSLDLSVEDFPPEPGYAECADAIKSGAIKKISISHERLITDDSDDIRLRKEHSSEIYANPQILFKKRSKLIERTSGELSPSGTCSDLDLLGSIESLDSNSAFTVTGDETEQDLKKEAEPTVEAPPSPEAPPLPARNYSLYLEGDEAAEFVPEDCDKLSGSDDAFESESVVTDTALSMSEGITNLSKNLNVEDIVRTYSECFEVHTDSQICEGTETAEGDFLCDKNTKDVGFEEKPKDLNSDQKIECQDSITQSNPAMSDCSNVSHNNCVTSEFGAKLIGNIENLTGDECIHVTVFDKQGNTNVLTVVDKQAVQREKHNCHGMQKRSGKELVHNYDSEKIIHNSKAAEVNGNSEVIDKVNNENEKEITGELGVKKLNTGNECREAYQEVDKDLYEFNCAAKTNNISNDKVIVGDSVTINTDPIITDHIHIKPFIDKNSHLDCAGLIQDDCVQPSCSNNGTSVIDKKQQISSREIEKQGDGDSRIDVKEVAKESDVVEKDCHKQQSPTQTQTYRESIQAGGKASATNETQSGGMPVARGNSLEVVHPVKMYSISWDSDEEFQGTEHLPKLEIVESDSENVFDASDNSLKAINESAEEGKFECVTDDLHCKDNSLNNGTTECSHMKLDQSDESKDGDSMHSGSGRLDHAVHFDDVDSGGRVPDSAESVHATSASKSNTETNNAKQIKCDHAVDVIHHEAKNSDDGIKTKSPVSTSSNTSGTSHTSSMCNGTGKQLDKSHVKSINHVNETVVQDSHGDCGTGLPVITSEWDSALYNDSEPTHMSLTDIMTLSSASDSTKPTPNQLSNSSARNTANVSNSEPVIPSGKPCEGLPLEQVTPPPRPPSYSSGQSKDRNSSSSQSGQSNTSSPLDDTLPGFRFAERTLSDVDESPPAIPPRTRIQKAQHQKRDSVTQDFMESMRQLKDCGWYWGPLSWEEAEQKLSNKPEGTFLVRDSSDERYILSLSFKNQGRVHHTRIEHHRGNFSFWSQPDSHGKSTIKEFIDQCVHNSENGRFLYFIRPSGPGSPPMPIHLLFPVSRFIQMQSLQHMCRFRILQMVRRDHIETLPVPTRIKQYLKEAQYYVECLDD